ncbi:tetratricopeptide repeat protein [Chondromyces crocatus]|uniref:PEGA domain-containing protein n=1 Tax=Chondromyces crocatus TaxID=52 RepID=A0A0K1E9E4_CHOCO|nr:tetratricopeptide repeat protein [Chondromyces crocatus]AKT37297.1 uncharacterized protein CMC5_014280 [Chondromyces crocatus]
MAARGVGRAGERRSGLRGRGVGRAVVSVGRTVMSVGVVFTGWVGPAAAEDVASAEALFNRGKADMLAGRYEAGCAAIAESQRIDPRPGTLFTLAECESRRGRSATAAAHFSDYLEIYEKLPRAQKFRQGRRPQVAEKERDRLRAEAPELTLALPATAPRETVVKRDGEVVGSAALEVPLPVDPGEHRVSTEVAGAEAWEVAFTLAPKEKKHLRLEVKLPKPPEPPPEPPPVVAEEEVSTGRRALTFTVGGLGIAGLAVGGVMGALALGAKGTMGDHCGGAIGQRDARVCDAAGLAAVDRVKMTGLVSTIGFAVGAAGVGTALVLLLTEPRGGEADTGQARRWVSAGVLSAGPAGAMLGVQGAW